MVEQTQAKLKLLYECNEDCIFCTEKVDNKDIIKFMPLNEVKKQVDIYSKKERVFLVMTGGEPTLREDIVEIIKYANKNGITNIAMQTNAIKFADKDYTKILVEAGLSFVSVTIAGHNAEIHDSQTRLKGSFNKTMLGLKNIVDSKIRVMVYVIITNYNYKHLGKLAEMLVKSFPTLEQIQLTMPCVSGGALTNFYEVVPQFSRSYKFVHKAIKIITNSRIELTVDNLPLCFLEGYEKHSSDIKTYLKERTGQLDTYQVQKSKDKLNSIANYTNQRRKNKVKSKSCKLCSLDFYCDGVWKGYAEKYTTNELIPVINRKINLKNV